MMVNGTQILRAKGAGRLIAEFLYPSRLLFYLWLLLFGFFNTARQAGMPMLPGSWAELLKLGCAASSITLLFAYAKIINDIHDLAIDRISNSRRPLVEGVISEGRARRLATILLTLSAVLAIPVGSSFFSIWFLIWGLSYLYSAPPMRVRRFWPVGSVTLALIGGCVFIAGTCISRPNGFGSAREDKEIIGYLLTAFFFLCQIKDLKDIEGDSAAGVGNIFAHVSHPRVLALILYGCFLGMAFLLAIRVGVEMGTTVAGTLACAAAALFMIMRTQKLAGLDRLFVLSFLFLMYLSGAWLLYCLEARLW